MSQEVVAVVVEEKPRVSTLVKRPINLSEPGTRVRVLELDGQISPAIWTVQQPPDRTGKVVLTADTGSRTITRRRLLPADTASAVVVEAGDKFKAMCPRCGVPVLVSPAAEQIECAAHGTFSLYWLGVRPVIDHNAAHKPAKAAGKPAKPARQAKPAAPRPTAPAAAGPQRVDLAEFRALGELWTKQHIPFDCPNITVCAHVLLVIQPEQIRKFCFNTYDGGLGKKSKPFNPDDYRAADAGYPVKDLAKEQAKLIKNGYDRDQSGS